MSTESSRVVGLLLSDDLMFSSRITATARQLGLEILAANTQAALERLAEQQQPGCVILDLSNPGLDVAGLLRQLYETCEPSPFVVGYGSHIDTATLRAAREAGCDVVLPRSKFVEELPRALPEWFTIRLRPEIEEMEEPVRSFVARYTAYGLWGTPATPEEVAALERQLGVVFPAAYKAFLLILGRDGGPDFVGSDCTIRHLPKLREGAERLLLSCDSPFRFPQKAVVFLMHQGYYFVYFVADGSSEDPSVFSYLEGDGEPIQKAKTFSAWLQL